MPHASPRRLVIANLLACLALSSCGGASAATSTPAPPPRLRLLALSHAAAAIGARLTLHGENLHLAREIWLGDTPQEHWHVQADALIVDRLESEAPAGRSELRLRDADEEWHTLALDVFHLSSDPRVWAHGSTPMLSWSGPIAAVLPDEIGAWIDEAAVPLQAAGGAAARAGPVADDLPTGWRWLHLQLGHTRLAPLPVAVVRLCIEEVDCDTPGVDTLEFVEVGCGLRSLDLSGYTLVFHNGGHVQDGAYAALHLAATAPHEITSPDGLLLTGTSQLAVPPRIPHRWAANLLQNGSDAVALYQGLPADFPAGTPPTRHKLIDAVVYGTNDPVDPGLLQALLGTGPEAVQADEDEHRRKDFESLQRRTRERLDGRAFAAEPPTPWKPPVLR